MIRKEDALQYHSSPSPGKLAIIPTKPCRTQRDLSLAYTPGVAAPCLEIQRDPSLAYKYTAKGNLVAVVSNGTAVLGLGNIGAQASKPVMEGKAVLFKRFADIDVFDIELATEDPREIIRVCQLLEPTFGGINLEDIKAPECFGIEEELKRTLKIPVLHDDQHGTAIISGAALINALEVVGKRIEEVRITFSGAGAAALSCAAHYVRLGVRRQNIIMCDIHGVVYKGRTEGMNPYMERFAADTDARTLAEALEGADVFVGLSAGNIVTPEMLKRMARDPIIFALANPEPEIPYDVALAARPDAVVCTGRSDYPNQVNNVLGFPFIFRGALDVRATTINDDMKLAATRALAALAKEDVPDSVRRAYGVEKMEFGPLYLIPKPFDPRVLIRVASAVAQAAMESGVAQQPIPIEEYREQLERRFGKAHEVMRAMIQKARKRPQRIVFPEGEEPKILRACQILVDEGIAEPVLLGRKERVCDLASELHLNLRGVQVIELERWSELPVYAEELYRLRRRKGITRRSAEQAILNPNVFGAMMLHMGHADALVGGLTQDYPEIVRPAIQVIATRPGLHTVSGLHLLCVGNDVYFLADCTVNIDPTSEDLAEIAVSAADMARRFDVEPKVAMLSFSNFGSSRHPFADKVRRAVELLHAREPRLAVDGEMQPDTAIVPEILEEYPFAMIKGGANVLIFPNLEAGSIAYRLLARLGGAEVIGPILMGLAKPVHVLRRGSEVNDIVNMAAIAVVDAQASGRPWRPLAHGRERQPDHPRRLDRNSLRAELNNRRRTTEPVIR
ncbi:MAG TPA: NADP-dependent malic enzyme [Bryobacteraceae bacterium]|nr:NADP-dependent malic enzyme [Bryobacteraceae bacterium]HOQ47550.1 NADP-dependent malic enzyme [Bryobacteraceae bacterium]HPQ15650.1 NADP-dependent malic enzyme [Bryobacteraceae bacterium]HPU73522.1 NADP-dependent malic enzyme [Bryobacteraceae bacterium]